jgi:GAF domain-containing protein
VARPTIPWLERQSTNRDAIMLFALGIALPLVLGILDATKTVKTLAVGAWVAIAVGFLLLAIVYRLGGASVRRTLPVDVDRYVEHATDAIETIQKVASGTIPPIEVGEFVQEGIFEPAHTILSQRGRNDDRFTPHPEARPGREYASIIAVPIRKGHDVVAVFVVVAQNPEAFSEADVAYVGQLGALIGLARAVADA